MRKSRHSKDYAVFVTMLRELREDSGVTQVEMAKRLGKKTTQSVVSKCENGERRLDVLELRQWCLALDVDLVDFVKSLQKKLSRR